MLRQFALLSLLTLSTACASGAHVTSAKLDGATSIVAASSAPADDEYGLAALDPAIPLHAPAPEYPEAERLRGIEARVVVRYVVDESGKVTRTWASGPEAFRVEALAALAQWQFKPATSDGRAKASMRSTEFVFRVKA